MSNLTLVFYENWLFGQNEKKLLDIIHNEAEFYDIVENKAYCGKENIMEKLVEFKKLFFDNHGRILTRIVDNSNLIMKIRWKDQIDIVKLTFIINDNIIEKFDIGLIESFILDYTSCNVQHY